MPAPVFVNVELEDILTGNSCSQLVIEFVKYISYQRQQIPFPFKQLNALLTKRKDLDTTSKVPGNILPVHNVNTNTIQSVKIESEFFKVKDIFESMQSTFQHLEEELDVCDQQVVEVVIILGPTPLSPKDVYRLQLPTLHHGHVPSKHPHQRNILQFFKCLIQSEDLHSMLNTTLAPTNLFIFILKEGGQATTAGFVPKERYNLPQSGKHCVIKFNCPSVVSECTCGGINVYQDELESQPGSEKINKRSEEVPKQCLDYTWFQAHNTFKGFRDTKVNGRSVSSFWLQTR